MKDENWLRKTPLDFEIIEQRDCSLGPLTLRRYVCDDHTGYEIRLAGRFLMATDGSHSETALAEEGWRRVLSSDKLGSVLVAGLGVGETLAKVVTLPKVQSVVVVEVAEAIVEWNRRYFHSSKPSAIDDPRVSIVVSDLYDYLHNETARFDLILLDIDNGPSNLATERNQRLYDEGTLRVCFERLAIGGVVGIWAAHPEPLLLERFNSIFDDTQEVVFGSPSLDCPPDCLYFGVRRA